jgi:hypothetical protein
LRNGKSGIFPFLVRSRREGNFRMRGVNPTAAP